ncbi:hypothetical protein KCP69_06070 [Salmonella enterica subsp. enterica]|nr:hypothetical protein KCP69_06070 [Salmonella enterica subsp. enterica]
MFPQRPVNGGIRTATRAAILVGHRQKPRNRRGFIRYRPIKTYLAATMLLMYLRFFGL